MRQEPAADHLDLWRGIDDAVWREAARAMPRRAAPPPIPSLASPPPAPTARKVPEPA